jgi:hypothetical protein
MEHVTVFFPASAYIDRAFAFALEHPYTTWHSAIETPDYSDLPVLNMEGLPLMSSAGIIFHTSRPVLTGYL